MSIEEKELDHLRQQMADVITRTDQWGARLATWLIVGHAASAVFILREFVIAEHALSDAAPVSLRYFVIGLLLAFAGGSIGYISSQISLRFISLHAAGLNSLLLARQNLSEEQANEIQVSIYSDFQRHAKRFKRNFILVGFSLALFAVSAILFGLGLITPLLAEF
ncbi:MAG: hypothetical protein AAFQ22_02350 [Pseudomonadota bacterium]